MRAGCGGSVGLGANPPAVEGLRIPREVTVREGFAVILRIMPPSSGTFYRTIVIETRKPGRLRVVGSAREAAEALVRDWPEGGRGPATSAATWACLAALEGTGPVEKAREAFIAAAKEANIFVRAGR